MNVSKFLYPGPFRHTERVLLKDKVEWHSIKWHLSHSVQKYYIVVVSKVPVLHCVSNRCYVVSSYQSQYTDNECDMLKVKDEARSLRMIPTPEMTIYQWSSTWVLEGFIFPPCQINDKCDVAVEATTPVVVDQKLKTSTSIRKLGVTHALA